MIAQMVEGNSGEGSAFVHVEGEVGLARRSAASTRRKTGNTNQEGREYEFER